MHRRGGQFLACEKLYGYEGDGNPEHIVLDGQQRLTAMYYAFSSLERSCSQPRQPVPVLHPCRRFKEAYEEAFPYDWTQWGLNILKDRTAQYESHVFPLLILGQGGWELGNWVQGYGQHWRDRAATAAAVGDQAASAGAARHEDNAHEFGLHLKAITEQYQVAYIELYRDLELDKVCDIFTQINSKGIRLDVFDLINAFLKPRGLQLKHLWRQAAPKLSFIETERMNVYILQVMSILRQAYCSPKYLYYLIPGQEKTVREPDRSLRKEVLRPPTH